MREPEQFDQQMEKTRRQVALLAYLLERSRDLRAVTFNELRQTVYRDHRGDSRALARMFSRDKAELREMGVPIETVPSTGDGPESYKVPNREYFLPPLELEPGERMGLALIAQLFLGPGTPFGRPAHYGFMKMDFHDGGGDKEASFPGLHLLTLPRDSRVLGPLLDGLKKHKDVTFAYRAADAAEPVERTVSPYGLFNREGAWYLVGRCHLRDEVRTFKLDRMTSGVAVNRGKPSERDFELPDEFDLKAESCWEGFIDDDPEVTATVEFSPRLAFARGSRYEPLDVSRSKTGDFRAKYRVKGYERFVDWVLCFGADARILSPPVLVEMVKGRCEGLLRSLEGTD